jgi:uncharacterized delta-60 repeat protein
MRRIGITNGDNAMSSSKTPSENLDPHEAVREVPASALGSMRRAGRRLMLAACLFAALLIAAVAQATPGALDPSFGAGGKVTTAIGGEDDYAYALVRQPDGKLVAAGTSYNGPDGDFTLARYNPDGSLDPGFGSGGKVTTAIGAGDDGANALALQPDGRLVAAGYGWNGSKYVFALARYNPDGTLDPTFGSGGKVITPIGSGDDFACGLALQPDGKLVATGPSNNGSNYDFALARYNPDGSLDPTFGSGGKVTTAIGPGNDRACALALHPDGKLVAAGHSANGSQTVFALARYHPDGSLDTTFNGTGKVTTAIGSGPDEAHALALQPDGKLLAAGNSHNGTRFVFALARYKTDGSLDTGFNGTGKVTTAIGLGDERARALALQPDGRFVAAGFGWNGSKYVFALARYKSNGTLDASFNGTGKVTTAIGSGTDAAYALALQPDGKLVAVGNSDNGSDRDFSLVRYRGSTLTVAKTGSSSGSVTSSPAGISCGSTCSAPFAAVPVTLTATPAAGSRFAGWSGACSGTGTCTLTMSGDRAATARFVRCVVPKVKGKTLLAAKRAIRQAHCSVGTVTRVFSATVKKGHVISTKPKPGTKLAAGSKIKLKVSKGKA